MEDHTDPATDSVFASDRDRGSTAPEDGAASSNVVGRPNSDPANGFHEPEESAGVEREPFNPDEALTAGGSFDGLGVPAAE